MSSLSRLGSWVLVGAALAACSDTPRVVGPTRITAADAEANSASTSSTARRQFVFGDALFEPADQGVSHVRYVVIAVRKKSGLTVGEFEMRLLRGTNRERFNGDVSCFTIDGNTARIAVKVEESNNPDVKPGDFLIFTAQDNNDPSQKRADRVADQTSFVFLGDASVAQFHCDVGFSVTMYPLERGQIELIPNPDNEDDGPI